MQPAGIWDKEVVYHLLMTVVHFLVLIICVLHHVQLTMLLVLIRTLHVVSTLIYVYNTLILYYIECDYTCGPGEVANPACNGCNLIDICLRDKPCQNGGSCILLSSPDNYICNCSGTGYMGTNCTGKLSILLHILSLCNCYY